MRTAGQFGGRVHVDVVRAVSRGRRAVGDLAGAGRTGSQASRAAHQVHISGAAGQLGGVGIRVRRGAGRRAGSQDAALGHRERARVSAVLQLGAILIELAYVDHQRAHPEQHAARYEYRYQHPDGTLLAGASDHRQAASQEPPRTAEDQVSHGMTPCAVSVIVDPKLEPKMLAIAATGVMNENL